MVGNPESMAKVPIGPSMRGPVDVKAHFFFPRFFPLFLFS